MSSTTASAQKTQLTVCVCVFARSLSSSVLQGFTCLSVSTLKKTQVKRLIRACRRKGKKKVLLRETQV